MVEVAKSHCRFEVLPTQVILFVLARAAVKPPPALTCIHLAVVVVVLEGGGGVDGMAVAAASLPMHRITGFVALFIKHVTSLPALNLAQDVPVGGPGGLVATLDAPQHLADFVGFVMPQQWVSPQSKVIQRSLGTEAWFLLFSPLQTPRESLPMPHVVLRAAVDRSQSFGATLVISCCPDAFDPQPVYVCSYKRVNVSAL